MDIYRILENFNAASREPLTEGVIGSIAGGLAGTAVGGPIGGVVGSALGNAVTDEARDPSVWDAQALAQQKAKLAREKRAMGPIVQTPSTAYDQKRRDFDQSSLASSPKPLEEMIDDGLDHICRTHKAACDHFRDGGELDSELYDALYNHYLSKGEMPYGVAKARDDDPMNWCAEKLAQHLGLEECGTGWPLGAGDVAPMAESVDRISFLAGLTEGRMCSTCKCKPCECNESEMEEGNDFTKARLDAINAGKDTFKVGGKTYKVKGDTSDEKKQVKEDAKPDFLDLDKDGNKKEPMKKAAKEKKVEESKPVFPGSSEYEKKYGKVKHDDDSAFHKTKVSTGTVYSRKHKEEPEADDEDDTPKKKGRPTGTKRKIGAKGPSTTSKLIKDGPKKAPSKAKKKVKEGLDIEDQGEYDEEGSMVKDNIHTIRRAIDELENCVGDNDNMPEWVEEKISQAKGMIQSASEYIQTQKERGVEDETGEEGIEMDEAGYSAKAARAGKDIGKPGKNFNKIAKGAAERYGSKAAGERVAGAVLNKLRHPKEGSIEERSVSQAQQRTMGAAAHNPKFAKKVGIKPGVAKEFNRADKGHKMSELPRRVKETGMGGTVAGGMAPAPGAKTFAEASSGSHEAAWKAAGKAVHAIMKKRGYTGSKTEEGYMWTKQTPRGTAFIDIDFDERDPETARWGEGELKGAKNKSYWQSGNDNISDLAQVIGQLFANVKDGQPAMDEADEDGKPNFAKKDSKHKPDDDGDGVPDWADKKPGKDDNEESGDSEESDEEDDDKALKKMKSHAGIEDKDDDSDKEESDDKPKKGKKPDFGKKKDDDSDDEDDSDDSDDEESNDKDDSEEKSEKKDSGDSEEKSKDKSGTPYGKSVYESAFKKSLKTQLRESVNMNTSQDDTGKKSVTVTATDEDADKLSELLKMAGLFSSQGYSSVCQGCGGVHEAGACGAGIEVAVDEAYGDIDVETNRDLANSPDENYSDENTMINTLSGGLNGRKSTGQSTGPVVNRQDSRQGIMGEAQKVQEEARNRLWKLYGEIAK